MTVCVIDGQPADGAVLCGHCRDRLARCLLGVPGLLDDLEVTVTRQSETGVRGGGKSKPIDPPMPFDVAASDHRDRLRDVLVGWASDIAERTGQPVPYTQSLARSTVIAARYLLDHIRAIQHHPAAEDIHDELRDAVRQATAAVDQPPDRVFRGWCCSSALYAAPNRTLVRCRECWTEYAADDARQALVTRLWDHWATSDKASAALAAAGLRVSGARIRMWHKRGKLSRRDDGTYRLGDVIQVASGG